MIDSFTHSYQDIISVENLLEAWREFLRGKRKKHDVQEFGHTLMDNIFDLHRDLKNKIYVHGPYHAFNISDSKPRNIHKASVRDRLLHHAIYRSLYPYFDKKFIYDSYSCRVGKGTHKALNRFRSYAYRAGKNHTYTVWVLKSDIKKFFASIDHRILITILAKHTSDSDTLWLLGEVIESFHTEAGKGLPLGNLTSQLLVNIYMNEFDQFVKHTLKARYYIRYADDFVIFDRDRDRLAQILQSIGVFVRVELALELHPHKVSIFTVASGIDFLGWVHFPAHRVPRTSAKRRMFRNIYDVNVGQETAQSYLGLLQHGNTYRIQERVKLLTEIRDRLNR